MRQKIYLTGKVGETEFYMNIIENYLGKSGVQYVLDYSDCDDFSILPYEKCKQVYSVCYVGNTIVIGYGGKKESWGLIGGTIEKGETFEETLKREVIEESNVQIEKSLPIGYQKVTDTRDGTFVYQLRYVSIGHVLDPFVSDPAGTITKVTFIHPDEYQTYFYWGKIGERIMERAKELRLKL